MKIVALLLALVFTAGCQSTGRAWPQPRLAYTHAATFAQADARARAWTAAAPGNRWGRCYMTGSMRPWITGSTALQIQKPQRDEADREILLWQEQFADVSLEPGLVVRLQRTNRDGTITDLVHMIADVRGEWIYLTGLNNPHSDGWHHRSKVRGILREVVTLPEGAR